MVVVLILFAKAYSVIFLSGIHLVNLHGARHLGVCSFAERWEQMYCSYNKS